MNVFGELWKRRRAVYADAAAAVAGLVFLVALLLAGDPPWMPVLLWLILSVLRAFSPTVALSLLAAAPVIWWWAAPESPWWAALAAVALVVQLAVSALQSSAPRSAVPNRERVRHSMRQVAALSVLPLVLAATAAGLGHREPETGWTVAGLLLVLAITVAVITSVRRASSDELRSAQDVAIRSG